MGDFYGKKGLYPDKKGRFKVAGDINKPTIGLSQEALKTHSHVIVWIGKESVIS